MKKRLISLFLALLLCIALLPAAALAEEEQKTEVPEPPVVTETAVRQSGSEAWVEVTISTPTSVRNLFKTLKTFGLGDLVNCIQMSLSVDGGDWQLLNLSAVEVNKNLEGSWRSEPVSGLKSGSQIQFRVRYYGIDETDIPVISAWSEIISFQSEPFEFNAHDWAKPELAEADGLGLIPAGLRTTDLKLPITRAEFAAVSVKVYEALSGTVAEAAAVNPFTDTGDIDVLKAFNVGITNGVSATEFGPAQFLNREQAATMLARVFKKVSFSGWTLGTDGDFAEQFRALFTMPAAFADDGDISSWARDSVYFMAANGVIKGMEGNTFQPRAVTAEQQASGYAQATREQAILIAVRMVKNLITG